MYTYSVPTTEGYLYYRSPVHPHCKNITRADEPLTIFDLAPIVPPGAILTGQGELCQGMRAATTTQAAMSTPGIPLVQEKAEESGQADRLFSLFGSALLITVVGKVVGEVWK